MWWTVICQTSDMISLFLSLKTEKYDQKMWVRASVHAFVITHMSESDQCLTLNLNRNTDLKYVEQQHWLRLGDFSDRENQSDHNEQQGVQTTDCLEEAAPV